MKGKGKAQEDTRWLSEEDYVSLVRLSVSDYALWSDTDLRKTIEFADDGCTSTPSLYIVFGLITDKTSLLRILLTDYRGPTEWTLAHPKQCS